MLMSMMCVYVCACYAINHLFLEVSPASWQAGFFFGLLPACYWNTDKGMAFLWHDDIKL